jgi:hypothetical protein
MKRIVLVFVIILISIKIFSQDYDIYGTKIYDPVISNETNDLESVKNAKVITYYGLDFSLLKFIKLQNVMDDDKMRKYLGGWISYYHKYLPPYNYLFKKLKFDNYLMDYYSVQNNIDSVARNWIVASAKEVNINDISASIKKYDLEVSNGIGFVIHPVEFIESKGMTKCYFTFFEINTRKILWVSEIQGSGNGSGITQLYGRGMIVCTKNYIKNIYQKEIMK